MTLLSSTFVIPKMQMTYAPVLCSVQYVNMYKEEKSNIVNIFTSPSSIASQHFQVFVVFHITTQRESIVGPTVTVAKSTQVLTFGKFIFKNP